MPASRVSGEDEKRKSIGLANRASLAPKPVADNTIAFGVRLCRGRVSCRLSSSSLKKYRISNKFLFA